MEKIKNYIISFLLGVILVLSVSKQSKSQYDVKIRNKKGTFNIDKMSNKKKRKKKRFSKDSG